MKALQANSIAAMKKEYLSPRVYVKPASTSGKGDGPRKRAVNDACRGEDVVAIAVVENDHSADDVAEDEQTRKAGGE